MGYSVASGNVGLWEVFKFTKCYCVVNVLCKTTQREGVKIQDERDHCRALSLRLMGWILQWIGELGKKYGLFHPCPGKEGKQNLA